MTDLDVDALRVCAGAPRPVLNGWPSRRIGRRFLSSRGASALRPALSAIAVVLATLTALQALPVHAQGADEPSTLERVVVTGVIERAAQRAAKAEAASPNAVAVIDAEQLAQFGEQSLGDALRRVPGVSFDGANRAREVRLRGLPDQYTQVLVNGRRLLDGNSRRTVEVDRIPTGLVERIEVIRAPRAGMDAQGAAGTINIVLKDGAQLPTQFTIGAGHLQDNGAQGEAGLVTGGTLGSLDYALAFNAQRFRRSESKDSFSFNAVDAPTGATLGVNQRRFDQMTLAPRLRWAPGGDTRLRLEPIFTRTQETRDDISTPLKADLVTRDRVSKELRVRVRQTHGAYAALEQALGQDTDLLAAVDWQRGEVDTERDEARFNTDGSVNRTRQRTELIQLRSLRPEVVLSLRRGSHALRLGVEGLEQTYDENNGEVTNGVVQPPRVDRIFKVDERRLVWWAEDQWRAGEHLDVNYGLRHEASKTITRDFFDARSERSSGFLLPSMNLKYALTPTTDVRWGLARTLRRPDLRSLSPATERRSGSAADPDRQGNPAQRPESVWGVDAGVQQAFAQGRGQLSLNAFARRFADKIEDAVRQESGRFVASPENVGNARATGLELATRVPLDTFHLKQLTLWGNAVYTRGRVDEVGGGSRRFADQPDVVANLGADYELPAWRTVLGLAVNWTAAIDQSQRLASGGRLDSSIDARTRVDLSLRSRLSRSAVFSFSLTNLLGETEQRVDRVLDGGGKLQSTTRTAEPTYRAAYARLDWTF